MTCFSASYNCMSEVLHKSKNTQDFDLSSTQGFKHKRNKILI